MSKILPQSKLLIDYGLYMNSSLRTKQVY